MVTYRGIDQKDVYSSIIDAIAFLEKHSTGRELRDHLAQIDLKALGAIKTAADEQVLAAAVWDSGVLGSFCWISSLLEHHRLNNTKGEGRAIVDPLDTWGARSGARAAVLTPLDEETDRYTGRRKPFLLLKLALSGGAPKRAEPPFRTYCLNIPALQAKATHWMDKSVTDLREDVEKILSPFRNTDDVGMTGIGSSEFYSQDPNRPMGVMLEATPRAAQAVANAFPGYTVYVEGGAVIAPATALSRKNPEPKR